MTAVSSSGRILVVDDELHITQILETSLAARNYDVRSAGNGQAALELFRQWQPDLVITDLSMPKMSGVALCQAIRSFSNTPIIVLSIREQEAAKVEALECGADDYITKPFGMNELLARVKAALRRASTAAAAHSSVLEAGQFRMDLTAHQAQVGGKEVYLTPKEFELLSFLLKNTGRVITHKELLAAIWGRAFADQPDAVRVLVRQLRKKIEPDPAVPKFLKTEPWIGYRFEP